MKKLSPHATAYRFTSLLERSDNRLWGAHFLVPNHIAGRLINGRSRRVVCTLNGSVNYQCAMLPHGNGSFVITVNKKLRDRLNLSFGSEMDISLAKDTSAYGLPLPGEFSELLRQDPEGGALFHDLTRGRQRTLLYMIGSAKSSERRIERSMVIVNHLKSNGGRINYRLLYESLKIHRHRTHRQQLRKQLP